MAEDRKEMIYAIKLDIEATNTALKQYAATLGEAQKVQAGMTENLKAANELAGREATARKKSKEVVDAEVGSIKALRDENKKLTEERNNTTLATEAGRKKVEDLNRQLDANNKAIKENVDAYTRQKIGIGDYAGALDKLVPGLGATVNGLKAFSLQLWALVANPVGATLTVIAGALFTIYKALTAGEEGQNRLNQVMAVGSAIMETLGNLIEGVGNALIGAFTSPKQTALDLVNFLKDQVINRFTAFAVILEGIKNLDFKQVANGVLQLGSGVENVIGKVQTMAAQVKTTIEQTIAAGSQLAKLQADIDRADRELVVARARTALEVAKLREQAVKQEGDERRKTIEQAIELERKLSEAEVERAKKVYEQKRLALEATGDDKEDKMALAQAEAELLRAEALRHENTLRFQKELKELREQEAKEKEDAAAKLKEEMDKAEEQARKDEEADALYERKVRDQRAKDNEKRTKQEADFKKKVDEQTTAAIEKNLNDLLGTQKINYKAGFELFKKGRLAEVLGDTNKAATAAMASASQVPLIGWILGPAAYAATYAKGIASYLAVSSIVPGFARGGSIKGGTRLQPWHGIPVQRGNGDNLLITAAIGETVVTPEQRTRLGGEAAFRKAGIPGYNTGGLIGTSPGQDVETRTAAVAAGGDALLSVVDHAIRNMRPVLVMQDYEYEQYKRDQVAARANVIPG